MPEGPEIRRAADALAKAVAGKVLTSVTFGFPKLKKFEALLEGRRIRSITSHGKAMLTQFDNEWTLYTHNQLYGVWKIVKAGQRPDTSRTLRVALETRTSAILLYSASQVAMWKTADLAQHPFLSKLGPDVLDGSTSVAMVVARLAEARFLSRALPALLLDQAFLAGIGNYLRSEILFEARIAPNRRARDLSAAERKRLAAAILAVPRHSYRTRKSDAREPALETADQEPEGKAIHGFRFHVYRRDGQPCDRCKTRIERQDVGGRGLYWCPHCQK